MDFEAIDIQINGGIQAIKLPESLKIDDNKVYVKRIGNGLYIIPYHQPWQSLIDSVHEFSDDFMQSRDQPNEQSRESFD